VLVPVDYKTFAPKWMDGKAPRGSGIFMKEGRMNPVYYPTIYACSPENAGRHSVIQIPPKVRVHPDIPQKDLETLRAFDDIIIGGLVKATSWNDYWQAYSELMDRCIENIAPGSGFLYTPRIFAARPDILPPWNVNLGFSRFISLSELLVYPPEFENSKYHPEKYEGVQKKK